MQSRLDGSLHPRLNLISKCRYLRLIKQREPRNSWSNTTENLVNSNSGDLTSQRSQRYLHSSYSFSASSEFEVHITHKIFNTLWKNKIKTKISGYKTPTLVHKYTTSACYTHSECKKPNTPEVDKNTIQPNTASVTISVAASHH